jgi:hypothetical protein
MKPLVPVQKSTTTGSLSTARSGVVSKPPSSATTRKTEPTTSTVTGKKPICKRLKEMEDDLILKFDAQVILIEEFQFDV